MSATIIKWPIPCIECNTTKVFEITLDQAAMLQQPKHIRPYIQEILPDMKPADREMFISGVCPECWDKLFGGMEE